MPTKTFVTPQDLVDAISETSYIALFDDANSGDRTTIDISSGVKSCIARAHIQVVSWLPNLYTQLPPESAPTGIPAGNDNIPVLLKDAELLWATIYAYRRHPEYVRTYSAEPGGPLVKEAIEFLRRVSSSEQRIAPTDTPPDPVPTNVGGMSTNDSPRLTVPNIDGTGGMGDF